MSSSTRRWTLGAVLAATLAAFAPNTVDAQPFTNQIEIASHRPALQDAIDAAGEQGMLIVDQNYFNLQPTELPQRFRMVGKGPQGSSILQFDNLAGAAVSIPDAGDAWVVLENLDIEGLYNGKVETDAIGIDLNEDHFVFMRNLTVRGFNYGFRGVASFSVFVENCNVSVNQTDNILLRWTCTSWRIEGCVCSCLLYTSPSPRD